MVDVHFKEGCQDMIEAEEQDAARIMIIDGEN
jgi:hypothetical protein